jgi:hypothetical protein
MDRISISQMYNQQEQKRFKRKIKMFELLVVDGTIKDYITDL